MPTVAQGPGIGEVTTVTGGLHWLEDSSEGRKPPPGLAFPFEVAYLDSGVTYAKLIEGAQNLGIKRLGRGELLLAATAAEIREVDVGGALVLDGKRWRVTGIVPDSIASGYEAIAGGAPPVGWGELYVLAESKDRRAWHRWVRRVLGPGEPFRIRAKGETPFLRYADGVTPQMYFKQRFGEFAARVVSGGRIEVDERWRRANIVKTRIPLVGKVTCHRKFVVQVRKGLKAIAEAGAANGIRPEEFAGCYSARFIGSDPSGRLSSHAWGAAVDLNAGSNPFGSEPTMDARIVRLLKEEGLNWGGDWLVPDGMHFEWAKIPTDFSR
jgi:hypothetical protein